MPEEKPGRIKKTRWFVCLSIWWVLAVFFYSFVATKETRLVNEVIATGISTVKQNTADAGLPLLERDVRALTRLAGQISQMEGVVNVSIIDHKNKLIAFTNAQQLPPATSEGVKRKDGVEYWTLRLPDGSPVIGFSGDISFAGTKIGEVFLVMDTEDASGLIALFIWAAVITLVLIVCSLLVIDFQGIHPLQTAARERLLILMGREKVLPEERELICPMCGSPKPLSHSFLVDVNLNRYPVIKPVGNQVGTAQILHFKGMNLRELASRQDLGWLRRQMIHRCLEIIKKLAGD